MKILAALVLATVAGTASAAVYTMTFDTDAAGNAIAEGATLSTQYAAWGVSVSNSGAPGFGAPYYGWASDGLSSLQITATDIGGGVTAPISGKLLHSFGGWLSEDGDPYIRMSFSTGIDSIAADFGGMSYPSSSGIYAYNGATLVGQVNGTVTNTEHLSLSGVGTITSIVLVPGDFGDWVGIDNVTFNTVPTPGAAALLGLGGLIVGRRRR